MKKLRRNGDPKHPLYKLYFGMITRCYTVNHPTYKNYGARGITVCDRWLNDFQAFVGDVGERPTPKHCLDRIDNNGNYEPDNVRWATYKENIRNSSKVVFGENEIKTIKRLLNYGFTPKRLSQIFNCGRTTIIGIRDGATWNDITI